MDNSGHGGTWRSSGLQAGRFFRWCLLAKAGTAKPEGFCAAEGGASRHSYTKSGHWSPGGLARRAAAGGLGRAKITFLLEGSY
ncbi:MAG: hypothetical protein LBJ82_01575, partial [Deltaproteobacteria bacterium]|nr:hypothetical protein [Deltaproteobacteria bacterium]